MDRIRSFLTGGSTASRPWLICGIAIVVIGAVAFFVPWLQMWRPQPTVDDYYRLFWLSGIGSLIASAGFGAMAVAFTIHKQGRNAFLWFIIGAWLQVFGVIIAYFVKPRIKRASDTDEGPHPVDSFLESPTT